MLLLRRYEQWRRSSFIGENFSTVVRGRKLYVIVIFGVDSAYVVPCCLVLKCVRQYLLLTLYITLVCD